MNEKSNQSSLRVLIDEYRSKMINSEELTLDEASKFLVELSALMGNVNEEIRNRYDDYIKAFIGILDRTYKNNKLMTVNRAEILVKITPEYKLLQEAKDYKDTMIEMIRSLKFRCRALSEEYRLSSNL